MHIALPWDAENVVGSREGSKEGLREGLLAN